MLGAEDKARIKWACRRGMLELDVIIMPFFEECFDTLTEEEKHHFVALLECDDPDLFTWLMGHGRSDKPELAAMIDKIVEHNRSKLR
ncbi:Antitoxin CptB [Grimontia celer]|uniref:FAD assembly factor SdhE n=1 Tax=Grimontia celer TaxID=1796497 RepID=A0A128FB20_9GAMM|nr:succinate dehydrogenase assembly factor 2 [Grimontia celer]CZF83695.1 Antitoxin CptB [Grimontia celer]